MATGSSTPEACLRFSEQTINGCFHSHQENSVWSHEWCSEESDSSAVVPVGLLLFICFKENSLCPVFRYFFFLSDFGKDSVEHFRGGYKLSLDCLCWYSDSISNLSYFFFSKPKHACFVTVHTTSRKKLGDIYAESEFLFHLFFFFIFKETTPECQL